MTDRPPPPTPGAAEGPTGPGRPAGSGGGLGAEVDWGAVLDANGRWLRGVVATRLGERQAVDEVMQEVALAAVAQRTPLLDPGRVVGWLYRLAVRQALLHRRRSGRRRALLDRYGRDRRGLGAAEADPAPSPLSWLVHDERRDLVRRALGRLPPRDADLLVMKYAEGWSARALADRLGVRVAAVEARLFRARARLRAELAALADEFSNDRDPGACDDGRA